MNEIEQSLRIVYQQRLSRTNAIRKVAKTSEISSGEDSVKATDTVCDNGSDSSTEQLSFFECLKAGFARSQDNIADLSGDVTFSRQTSRFYYADVDSNKPVNEMSMEEYKKYILNKVGEIPVSAFTYRNMLGPVTIQEACFEHMKQDPSYEKIVMDTMRMELTADLGGIGDVCMGNYVFGATVDEIRGTAYVIDERSTRRINSDAAVQKEKERRKKLRKKKEQEAVEKMLLERRIMRQRIENGEKLTETSVHLAALTQNLLSFL